MKQNQTFLGSRSITRREPTGGYNCAGLVWATRRSALPEPSDWEQALEDDGYRKIETSEHPKVGDIVVYRHEVTQEILHVARLCQMDHLSFKNFQSIFKFFKFPEHVCEI